MARCAEGTPVAAPLREENDFRMDVDEVASLVTDRTRLIVISSPHNPTGSILAADDIREIARIAVERDIVVLCSMTGSLQTPRTGRARAASSRLVMWRGSSPTSPAHRSRSSAVHLSGTRYAAAPDSFALAYLREGAVIQLAVVSGAIPVEAARTFVEQGRAVKELAF